MPSDTTIQDLPLAELGDVRSAEKQIAVTLREEGDRRGATLGASAVEAWIS